MTGKEVKEIREQMGVTQAQLAEMWGLKPRAIQKWEASESVAPSTGILLKALLREHVQSTPSASAGSGTAVAGVGNRVNADEALLRAFEEIAAQRRVTEKAQEQMGELLALMKSMLNK